jgi:chromosome segregation ATPase
MVTTQDVIDKLDETNSALTSLKEALEERGKGIKFALSEIRDIKVHLDAHDKRFDAHDKRFDAVDQRLDGIDQRLDGIDQRFVSLEEKFDKRFEQVDKRFEQVDKRFEQVDKRFDQVLQVLTTLAHRAE